MLRIAKKLALKSSHRQHHHAVIITKGGNVLFTGYNHKFQHAEQDAIRKLETWQIRNQRKLTGLTLYSFRFRKSGTWGNAAPCLDCNILLYKYRHSFSTIYYTNENGVLTKL